MVGEGAFSAESTRRANINLQRCYYFFDECPAIFGCFSHTCKQGIWDGRLSRSAARGRGEISKRKRATTDLAGESDLVL